MTLITTDFFFTIMYFPFPETSVLTEPLLYVSLTPGPQPSPSESNPGELTAPETGLSLVLSSLCSGRERGVVVFVVFFVLFFYSTEKNHK